jgi:DNA-binding transcriptional MerR regulator
MTTLQYPIRAVSQLTGLSIDTLRAWERRYRAIQPQRNDRGRLYSDAEVGRLKLLREVVKGGHPIGQVAALSDVQLQELITRSASMSAKSGSTSSRIAVSTDVDIQPIFSALAAFDYPKADRALGRLAMLVSPRQLIFDVVLPLMRQVGDEWHAGSLSIAQEHMLSAILRNLLGTLIRIHSQANWPSKLLFATPSGEHHEFGILSAALLAAGGGLGIVYMGADLPAHEIVEAAERSAVQTVVLGIVGANGCKEPLKELQQVSRKLPMAIELWVGGATMESLVREIQRSRALYLKDFKMLEQHLILLGARF